jgi:hypothetical protein
MKSEIDTCAVSANPVMGGDFHHPIQYSYSTVTVTSIRNPEQGNDNYLYLRLHVHRLLQYSVFAYG